MLINSIFQSYSKGTLLIFYTGYLSILQLLVERLNGRDRLNYTAIIRSLFEEVLGPPLPPQQSVPNPLGSYSTVDSSNRKSTVSSWSTRQRSSSVLETRTSADRKSFASGWNPSQHSTSVEELNHLQYSLV